MTYMIPANERHGDVQVDLDWSAVEDQEKADKGWSIIGAMSDLGRTGFRVTDISPIVRCLGHGSYPQWVSEGLTFTELSDALNAVLPEMGFPSAPAPGPSSPAEAPQA